MWCCVMLCLRQSIIVHGWRFIIIVISDIGDKKRWLRYEWPYVVGWYGVFVLWCCVMLCLRRHHSHARTPHDNHRNVMRHIVHCVGARVWRSRGPTQLQYSTQEQRGNAAGARHAVRQLWRGGGRAGFRAPFDGRNCGVAASFDSLAPTSAGRGGAAHRMCRRARRVPRQAVIHIVRLVRCASCSR